MSKTHKDNKEYTKRKSQSWKCQKHKPKWDDAEWSEND